jgi:hypothetical protein
LRVTHGTGFTLLGIAATGIVRGNTVVGIGGPLRSGFAIGATGIVSGNYVTAAATGISATGIVSGNYVTNTGRYGIASFQGSTVIGNTAMGGTGVGISVTCPSNVIDNTALNYPSNLVLDGTGCNDTNNAAP